MGIQTYSQACIDLVKESEGCSLHAYQDSAGVLTVGWGHTGSDVTPDTHWTQAQADAQLAADLQIACEGMQALVKVPLTQGQTDALTDFTFNEGARHLRDSTLLRKLNGGNYADVPLELLRWVWAGGQKLPGLLTRRQREVELWMTTT